MNFDHNPNVKTIALDVTSEESVNGAIKYVVGEEGKLDIVVCNAGIFHVGRSFLFGGPSYTSFYGVDLS